MRKRNSTIERRLASSGFICANRTNISDTLQLAILNCSTRTKIDLNSSHLIRELVSDSLYLDFDCHRAFRIELFHIIAVLVCFFNKIHEHLNTRNGHQVAQFSCCTTFTRTKLFLINFKGLRQKMAKIYGYKNTEEKK